MTVRFTKMHGAGNDFILIDDRAETMPTDRATLAALAARRTGIGCEGVILVQPSAVADFKMRFFNPDGGEAELCGNGARCVAAFARAIGAADVEPPPPCSITTAKAYRGLSVGPKDTNKA